MRVSSVGFQEESAILNNSGTGDARSLDIWVAEPGMGHGEGEVQNRRGMGTRRQHTTRGS